MEQESRQDEPEVSKQLKFVQGLLRQVLKLSRMLIELKCLLVNGTCGYNEIMQMVPNAGTEISSTTRRFPIGHLNAVSFITVCSTSRPTLQRKSTAINIDITSAKANAFLIRHILTNILKIGTAQVA
jgi:hypothetical protein